MNALAFGTAEHHALYMKSELWQRLRQARRYADLTQADLAARCNVTRGAVALWEAAEAEHRTKPTTDNIIKVAKETGAPLEWLLNDAADPEALWRLNGEFGEGSRQTKAPDVLPDVSQDGHLFLFASTPEQIAAKLEQIKAAPAGVQPHLVLVGVNATVITAANPADALSAVVRILRQS